jgi:hypothetical protein
MSKQLTPARPPTTAAATTTHPEKTLHERAEQFRSEPVRSIRNALPKSAAVIRAARAQSASAAPVLGEPKNGGGGFGCNLRLIF